MPSSFWYYFRSQAPKSVGNGININQIGGISAITVDVVPEKGPWEAGDGEGAAKKNVSEFWIHGGLTKYAMKICVNTAYSKAALDISSIGPILKENNVRLVGIGLGYNSMDGFMEGNYWRGNEIYVDKEQALYKALGLGKSSLSAMLDPHFVQKSKEAKGVEGNIKGDGMKLGGTYVIDKGGKILLEFQQKKFGDHPEPEALLKALGLKAPPKTEET